MPYCIKSGQQPLGAGRENFIFFTVLLTGSGSVSYIRGNFDGETKLQTCANAAAGDRENVGRRETQLEVVEHFELKDKYVVKELPKRQRRKKRT